MTDKKACCDCAEWNRRTSGLTECKRYGSFVGQALTTRGGCGAPKSRFKDGACYYQPGEKRREYCESYASKCPGFDPIKRVRIRREWVELQKAMKEGPKPGEIRCCEYCHPSMWGKCKNYKECDNRTGYDSRLITACYRCERKSCKDFVENWIN